jgi:hypothetical protein
MTNQTHPRPNRVFKIGATTIQADASFAGLSNDQAREVLRRSYPEVAHATMREVTLDDGTKLVEWLARPGREG